MSCGVPVTTPWLLQGPCLQPDLTPKIPAQSRTRQSKAPRGQPDPSLHGVFPELTAPGSSPGRDQRGAEPFSLPFIRRLVRSMCWSWRVNKHQSALTKRRMLSAKFNFGKADPVAPAPLGVACRGLVGAGSCQRAVPTSSPANAEEQRKLICGLREVGRYQSAAVEFFTLQTVKPHFQLCGTSGMFVCVFSYLGLGCFFFFLN